jgi:hypothetical protein
MQKMKENLAENPFIRKKRFPIFAIVSVVLLAITLCLIVASYRFDSWENPKYKLTLSKSFNVGIGRSHYSPLFGSLVFFNDDYPYSGSIISLNTGEEILTYKRIWLFWLYGYSHMEYTYKHGSATGSSYWISLPAIFFCYCKSPSCSFWTLTIGLWLPLTIFSVLPSIQILKWKKKRSQKYFS